MVSAESKSRHAAGSLAENDSKRIEGEKILPCFKGLYNGKGMEKARTKIMMLAHGGWLVLE